jgi:eukaryotic-like serine/threonine-protein kinase
VFLFYVMPYVEGGSLRQRLTREQQLPLGEAVRIAEQIASGLSYAHRHGVVHRDIKPENILLQSGEVVIADFGIARAITAASGPRLTETGIVVGTPSYMSPEQAARDDRVDGRSDIYSLGCVLYEMLAGHPPFLGSSAREVLARHTTDPVPPLRAARLTVPMAVEKTILRALEKAPADRFATAEGFREALINAEAQRPGRRRRFAAVVGAAGLLTALIIWGGTHRTAPELAGVTLDPTHVAVLYFDVLSDSARLAPLAAGLTEDLIDALGEVQVLSVKSPAAVRPYRGRSVPLDSIAHDRGVGTIVTGSVAALGDTLRVTVRLADGATGRQEYSETVKRTLPDLFQLEDSLAADLARFLRERLGQTIEVRERRQGTERVDAWQALRQADEMHDEAGSLRRRGDPGAAIAVLVRAGAGYAEAERLDPQWIVPIVERGRVALELSELAEPRPLVEARQHPEPNDPARSVLATDEWLLVGLRFARQALALKPQDPRALELRGTLRYRLWIDSYVPSADSVALAEQDLRLAVAREPSLASAWYRLSELLRFTGRFTEADWAARRALEADAYLAEAQRVYYTLFFTALNLERFDEAASWCRIGLVRYPDAFRDCTVRVLGWSSRGSEQVAKAWRQIGAVEAGRREEQSGPFWADRRLLVAAILARSGMADSARAVIRMARAGDPRDTAATWMLGEEAWVRVLLNERDEGLRLLAQYVESAGQLRAYIAVSPWYARLHGDSRFEALVRSDRRTP